MTSQIRKQQTGWRVWMLLAGMCGGLMLAGCGGSTGSSGSSDSGGSSGSGTGTNSNGTETGSTDSGFTLTGKLASLSVTGKSLTSGTISSVVAISPGTSAAACKTAEVNTAGKFSMTLPSNKPWLIYFIDSSKRGFNMFKGRLKSDDLDTLVPTSDTGSLDLGAVTVDSNAGTAASEKNRTDIVSGLGLDSTTAATVGALDDMARRYGNPDTDGDGKVDCNTKSASQPYLLDFHVRYNTTINGSNATVANVINSFFDDATTTMTYQNTGVYVVYPTSFSSASTGSVTFADSSVTTDEGGVIAAGTTTSAVTNNDYGSNHSFGPNISKTSELPSGTATYTMGSQTLTFSDITTPSLAQLMAPTGRIFPFLKFNTTVANCASNCTLSSVDYKWMKKTSTGWEAATVAELSALVVKAGGFLSIRVNNDANKTIGITIPKTSASGSIAWSASNATLSGVTSTEMSNLITTQLCHVGLSYDDQLGMRYFESIYDAAGTCS